MKFIIPFFILLCTITQSFAQIEMTNKILFKPISDSPLLNKEWKSDTGKNIYHLIFTEQTLLLKIDPVTKRVSIIDYYEIKDGKLIMHTVLENITASHYFDILSISEDKLVISDGVVTHSLISLKQGEPGLQTQ